MPLGIEQMVRGALNRSRRGLYGGKKLLSGNMISEDGKNKSRRTWKPNVQRKNLFSEALNRCVRLRITTSCLRTIDKYGGLDNYLLQTSDEKLASDVGSALKKEWPGIKCPVNPVFMLLAVH
ncbi:hypothetical protein WJX81_001880 [Elliptochloris bilobata]|uniref:Large ribosomal subunit protein bL28m n=1 Tax=Elliptochloris bilobata TaxID=381761 RepID=A0AAW1S988_9CHLO